MERLLHSIQELSLQLMSLICNFISSALETKPSPYFPTLPSLYLYSARPPKLWFRKAVGCYAVFWCYSLCYSCVLILPDCATLYKAPRLV